MESSFVTGWATMIIIINAWCIVLHVSNVYIYKETSMMDDVILFYTCTQIA